MQEKWLKYTKLNSLGSEYNIKSINIDEEGLKIILIPRELNNVKYSSVNIIFDGTVESYRYCDEHGRIETLNALDKTYGNKFYIECKYFIIKNSQYIKWLNKESSGITEPLDLKHFVFIDDDCILDIIVGYEPIIEFIKSK